MKKLIFILAIAVALTFALAACGDSGTSVTDSTTSEAPFTAKPVDGIAPLFDEGMSYYNIQPSIITESATEYHVYYTVNATADAKDSVIAYRKATVGESGTAFSEKKIVLAPSADGWDTNNYSNCDVIKGTFAFGGESYSYLMAYQANSSGIEKEFQIGLAASKAADGPFVKVGEPVISYDTTGYGYAWGCGQPSLVSYDKEGKVYLFYTMGDLLATQTYVAEIDAADLGSIKGNTVACSVSTYGLLENDIYVMLNDADFAIDSESGTLYVVRNLNPVASTAPNLNAAVQVAKVALADLYKPDCTWKIVEEKVNMLDLETDSTDGWERVYSACIVTDVYGNIALGETGKPTLGLTVTSYDNVTAAYTFYQTITIFEMP